MDCVVMNFTQIKNLRKKPETDLNYDVVVIDEAHKWITSFPKTSTTWGEIKPFTIGKPVIFSSGTLTPEGYAGLFNMLALSDNSPWSDYKRFTLWHEDYGKHYTLKIAGNNIKKYDRTLEEKVLADVEKYIVTITNEEGGHVHEAVDKPIKIELSKKQTKFYKKLNRDFSYPKYDIEADTPTKLLTKLHQIAGGFVKTDEEELYTFKKNPKMEWLFKNVPDPSNTIILAHHQAEQKMLKEFFPNTGSTTKNAEGVDYSGYETLIIYSFGFSASVYEQVRRRQMNINRKTPIEVIFLLAGLDEYVYKALLNKKNFTSRWYAKD